VSSVDDIVSQYAQNTQAWNNPYDAGVAGANTVNAAGSQSGITLRFKDGSTMQVADMAAAQPFINQSGATVESGNFDPTGKDMRSNMPVMDIPFKQGLSDKQKKDLYALVDSGRPLNETDAKNYAYAIGDSNWNKYVGKSGNELRTNTTPAGGTKTGGQTGGGTSGTSGSGTTGGTSGGTGTGTGTNEIDPQTAYSIDSLYKKYFDRPADANEAKFWATKSLDELNTFLSSEYTTATKHEYDGTPIIKNTTQSRLDLGYDEKTKAAISQIDAAVKSGLIPSDVGELFKATVASYPKGTQFNTEELLNTFKKIKEETIDPHFREMADLATQDIKNTLEYLNAIKQAELQSEQLTANQNITDTQQGLESSGMTFSGKAVSELGSTGAYTGQNVNPLLQQQGMGEGRVQAINRLASESGAARRLSNINQLGLKAEEQLGSGAASGILPPEYKILGGITGDITNQKQGAYGSTMQQILSQGVTKNKLNYNIN